MGRVAALRQVWESYNRRYFDGRLTPVPIRITRSRRTYGYFNGPNNRGSASIRVSKVLACTDELVRETVLHEMIHQFLYELACPHWDQHGPDFQREHKRIFGEPYVEP